MSRRVRIDEIYMGASAQMPACARVVWRTTMFETPHVRPSAEQTVFVTRLHWWTLASGIYLAAAAGVLSVVPVDVLRTVTTTLFGIVAVFGWMNVVGGSRELRHRREAV